MTDLVCPELLRPLAAGARARLELSFRLHEGATPAFAFFEDDDFPLCFRIGPLKPGPPKGTHPLSINMGHR